MERFIDRRRSKFLTLIVVSIISITLFRLLSTTVSPIFLGPFLIAPMFGMYFYFIYKYLAEKRGYQDRYQEQGYEHYVNQAGMRIIGLIIAATVLYFLIGAIFTIIGIEPGIYVFALTLVITVVGVYITDHFAGKDVEDYVQHKRKSHRDFVTSLGTAEGMCMSCRKKLDTGVETCPHCGYVQKTIGESDKGYISKH